MNWRTGWSPADRVGRLACGLAACCLLVVGGCATGRAAAGGPLPAFAEYEGREVESVEFAGDLELPEDSLRSIITTRPSRCRLLGFLPVCIGGFGREEYMLDLPELSRDLVRIQLFYRDHGFYGSRVVPSVEPTEEDRVRVRIAVAPGDRVILRELEVEGVEDVLPDDAVSDAMRLAEGEPFRRMGFLESADSLRSALFRRGYAYADVLRNYTIDTIADVAEAQFVALPGPLVYIDSIQIEGNERLDDKTIRQQITFSTGDLLRTQELVRSQRNLYALEMIEFAALQLAEVEEELPPDSTGATVQVQVAEAAQYLVDASAGFGTYDCVRASAGWVNRNLFGSGRRLELTGSLARIGASEPLDFGLSGGVCQNLDLDEGAGGRDDPQLRDAARQPNYRLAADFQQPRLFATRTQLGLRVHSERVTELRSFVRESNGAQLALSRQVTPRTILSLTADVENGRTLATPVVMCVGFDTCEQQDLDLLRQRRWSNFLALNTVREATRNVGPVLDGYNVRGGVELADDLLGSDNEYLRMVTEASYYHPLRPGWGIATNMRLGRFLQGSLSPEGGYIPPERRFYAGGPNSVRGFARNTLGPTVYVLRIDEEAEEDAPPEPSATGGTELIVASVELRTPSPYFRDLLRLAAFVDAGSVSARTADGDLGGRLRFTPGIGFRFITPVGPFRLDIAFNPYAGEEGPLVAVDETGIVVIDPEFQPRQDESLFRQLRFNFAFGQAF